MSTNLTPEMQETFGAIVSGEGIALFSGFLDGQPVGVIVQVSKTEGDPDYWIEPLAVMVTPEISARLTDHSGASPQEGAER